jgi:DNA-binding NarL/FixJ family response regulator
MFAKNDREDEDGKTDDPLENISDSRELNVESRLIMNEGFEKLSREQQIVAVMLLDGFQIESKDEQEPTISRQLNVSSRTIRNWIKEIRVILSDYRSEARQ